LSARDAARTLESANKTFRNSLHTLQEKSRAHSVRLTLLHTRHTEEERLKSCEGVRPDIEREGRPVGWWWWGRRWPFDIEGEEIDNTTGCVRMEVRVWTGKRADGAGCALGVVVVEPFEGRHVMVCWQIRNRRVIHGHFCIDFALSFAVAIVLRLWLLSSINESVHEILHTVGE